ncbi:MAG: hypothetical protein CMJ67_04000 [Planctomycetaceae bacterium]|nr:hypothetical protein [Planctomycetaceae bacterium]
MINQTPLQFLETAVRGLACSTIICVMVGLGGCGSEEEPAPVVKKKPKPAPVVQLPPEPTVTPVADLMAEFQIDPRISLPEDQAPDNDADRIAVLRFFDGFAKGDAGQLSGLLSGPDAALLQRMDESGSFQEATQGIMAINVQTGSASLGNCALALIMVDGEFEAQLWTYEVDGDPAADGARFDSVPASPDIVEHLSGDDWIAAWIAVMEGEWARATEPDEVIEIASTDLSDEEDSAGSSGNAPMGPGGGAPGRKRPSGPIVDPNPSGPGGPGGPIGR